MAASTHLRSRRSEAQLHALVGVEREIRAADPSGQRKYLREFSRSFRSYESVLPAAEWKALTASADVLLIGDYHALPACQRFAAKFLEERAQPGDRPVVLALETVFSRDQHILDEWWRREIDEAELRRRIRFDLDWGYTWEPFHELLVTAREHAEAIYGLDCMPREDLRKIGARDRHAAHKAAEIRQRHPNAVIMVVFGESHLAPAHLPRCLRPQMPQEKILTILQNVDTLYWQASGERQEHVEAVRVSADTLCVFNSTPLEKYENYRLHLSRWGRSEDEGPDHAPTIYNLIDSLLRFLGIDRYSSHNHTQPKFLVDMLPEIFGNLPDAQLRRLLSRETPGEAGQAMLLEKIETRGCAYLPRLNAFYVREFHMAFAAEEAARFLHHACRGLPATRAEYSPPPGDRFYLHTLEHALAYFGSRVLYPARPAVMNDSPVALAFGEIRMDSAPGDAAKYEQVTQKLGYTLGSDLYDRYLRGVIARRRLRSLFLTHIEEHIEEPGAARKLCLELAGNGRLNRKGPYSDHSARRRGRRVSTA